MFIRSATSTASIWATPCPCLSRITATTRRRRTSWSGCGESTSVPRPARPGPRVARQWPRGSRCWSAAPVLRMLELYTSEPNTFFIPPLIAQSEKRAAFTTHYFDAAGLEQFAGNLPTDLNPSLHLEHEGPLLARDGTLIGN